MQQRANRRSKRMPDIPEAEFHDRELLERIRAGEQDAAFVLYTRYAEPLMRLARGQTAQDLRTRFDPEDVVQSVFRTFFRRISNGEYEVPEGSELWKLLLVMALNKLRSLGPFIEPTNAT